jgi:hypothetical protein
MGRLSFTADFDDKLRERIKAATTRRNYLIHAYWRDNAIGFSTKDGRTKMIEELKRDADTFEQLDVDIRDAMKPTRKKLGIKEEILNEQVDKRLAEVRAAWLLSDENG